MMKCNHRFRRWTALMLMAMTLMTAVCPVLSASAEQTGEIPMESVSPYRIVLTAPGGWSSNGAVMKVSITDRENMGWYRIEYRMNDGRWIDCEDLFDKNKAEITVRENGTFTLRMTDPHGHEFEETAQVECIDLTAPVVSASINGKTLQVDARDALSGIAGVQINSMLFTTLTNGSLNVELDQNMNKFEKLAVRAFDYAGNFSEPITLDNPHYEKPVDPTFAPTATPKPTKKPSSESSGQTESQATNTPAATQSQPAQSTTTTTTNPNHGLGSSLIYVYDEPAPTTVPTQAPTPEPIIQTEYITIGPGMPYQADGNSHTLDVLYSAATNKQFITIQSKSGNTFYLVIDYDKPIDEEAEMYETYFLNLVDERDLLALMSDEEKEEVPTPTPEIIYVTPAPTAVPAPTPTAAPTVEPEKPDKPDQMTALLALAAIMVLGGAGAFVYFKSKSNTPKPRTDTDLDMDDEDEDETESTNE